ncbi:unnamed protein product [Rotaria sp. Silwood1]|nr:unnamed protein product [Rotaria sp. Silwood1]
MGNQTLTTIAASGTVAINTTTADSTAVLPRPVRRVLQNFLLVWLDANIDESNENFKKPLQCLRRIVSTITTFTDVDECIDFLSGIQNEKVFMIVAGVLGRQIIPDIEACPQLESIYVFCDNQSINEQWTKTVPKVKGVYTQIEPICEALRIDRENCDRAMISISFNGIDALFMYTQLLKETLLDIEDDDAKSIREFVDYCRLQGDIDENHIDKFEREYRLHTPIWWYTGPYFIYSMLNRALRLMDVDIILKMGFFIRHLHQHIETLHREQQSTNTMTSTLFQVFRGQGLSIENFEKMKRTKGGLMSFNNFLSTSCNRNVSLEVFARPAAFAGPHSVGILFVMTINATSCKKSSIAFVDVNKHGQKTLPPNHPDLASSYNNIGSVYDNMGEYSKALSCYERSLEIRKMALPSNHPDLAASYNNIGMVLDNMGEYSKALTWYGRALEVQKATLSPNHPDLATSYENIGVVLDNMGQYVEALSSYERALEIRKIGRPSNHPDLADSYNNIGLVYNNMGEYLKALSSYQRSLDIRKVALPPNHPDLATSYNNIGVVFKNMGEYDKALSLYEQSLEIRKVALPSNHLDFAQSYNNIGSVYKCMDEYLKALSYYEKDLEVSQKALAKNHPDLGKSYNNIGEVYDKMGEYSKALSYYERALEVWKIALPPTHPHITVVNGNIENIKKRL